MNSSIKNYFQLVLLLSFFSSLTIAADLTTKTTSLSVMEQILSLNPDTAERLLSIGGSGDEVIAYSKRQDLRLFSDSTFGAANIKKSDSEILTIFDPNEWQGGHADRALVISQGDIFGEGYYRVRYNLLNQQQPVENFSDFARAQPWLEWQPLSRTYKAHAGGAQERLLQQLRLRFGENITLYRGFRSTDEARFLKALAHLYKGTLSEKTQLIDLVKQYSAKSSAENQKGYTQALHLLTADNLSTAEIQLLTNLLLNARYSSGVDAPEKMFFSDKIELAREYSGENEFLQVTMSLNELQKLSQTGQLYVGIEYNFYEVLFKGADAVHTLLPTMQFKK